MARYRGCSTSVAVAAGIIVALACGGEIDNSTCERHVAPITLSDFAVQYATASTYPCCAPPQEILQMFFSTEPDACPMTFLSGDVPVSHDLAFLAVAAWSAAPSSSSQSSLVGVYPVGGTITAGTADVSTGVLTSGKTFSDLNVTEGHGAVSGTLAVTQIIEGVHVVGTLSAEFDDGTTLTFDFDVPFCTDACGQ